MIYENNLVSKTLCDKVNLHYYQLFGVFEYRSFYNFCFVFMLTIKKEMKVTSTLELLMHSDLHTYYLQEKNTTIMIYLMYYPYFRC
jgi:hypothetical protein